jgi:hypothetical protein
MWEFVKAENVQEESSIYRSSQWTGSVPGKVMWFCKKQYETKVFVEFMGWWLSEGSLDHRNKRIIVNQSREKNPDKYDRISELAIQLSEDDKIWSGKEKIYFKNESLYKDLLLYGHSHEKFIPQKIRIMSPDYLRIFLDAYAAGDGYRRKGKAFKDGAFRDEIIYTTSSKMMADHIGELLIKVGRRPSYYLSKTKGKPVEHSNGIYVGKHDMYIIRECYGRTSKIDRRTGIKKGTHIYNDMVYCVELAKQHTLLVRRNGKVTWCGNCRCAWIPVTSEKKKHKERVVTRRAAEIIPNTYTPVSTIKEAESYANKYDNSIVAVDVKSAVEAQKAGWTFRFGGTMQDEAVENWGKAFRATKSWQGVYYRASQAKGNAFKNIGDDLILRVQNAINENGANSTYRKVLNKYTKGKQPTLLRRPEMGNMAAAEQLYGTTHVMGGTHMTTIIDGIPAPGAATVSTKCGLAGTLRHEYGHTLWDLTDDAFKKKWTTELLKQSGDEIEKGISLYARHEMVNGYEPFCEVFELMTSRHWDASKFPKWVQGLAKMIEREVF